MLVIFFKNDNASVRACSFITSYYFGLFWTPPSSIIMCHKGRQRPPKDELKNENFPKNMMNPLEQRKYQNNVHASGKNWYILDV